MGSGSNTDQGQLTATERVAELEGRVAAKFADAAIALSALTHKSYCNEHKDEPGGDNERLEFLGDAVVDLAIGQRLFEKFPQAHEGELSKLRALVVNEDSLATVARSLSLGELLLLGKGEAQSGGRDKSSVLSDALEAVIAAMYLTGGGLPAVFEFVDRCFGRALDGVATGLQGDDYKSRLQEWAQSSLRTSPRYRVVGESGPDHEKVFEVELTIGEQSYGRSSGRSKKEAEQAAARSALSQLKPSAE